MFNPWSGYRVTGTWEAHSSYSYGGTDWPLGYGTELRAPASGRLQNNGWAGSAGRRATLYFDSPVRRVIPRSSTPMYGSSIPYVEHGCDMVAFVFQHAKGYLGDGHYDERALIGFSGASANGADWGGDAHLHGHGLCAHGARVDFMKFIGSATAVAGPTAIIDQEEELMPPIIIFGPKSGAQFPYVFDPYTGMRSALSQAALSVLRTSKNRPEEIWLPNQTEFDAIPKIPGSA